MKYFVAQQQCKGKTSLHFMATLNAFILFIATYVYTNNNCCYYSKTNEMHQCIKFILICNDTIHLNGSTPLETNDLI